MKKNDTTVNGLSQITYIKYDSKKEVLRAGDSRGEYTETIFTNFKASVNFDTLVNGMTSGTTLVKINESDVPNIPNESDNTDDDSNDTVGGITFSPGWWKYSWIDRTGGFNIPYDRYIEYNSSKEALRAGEGGTELPSIFLEFDPSRYNFDSLRERVTGYNPYNETFVKSEKPSYMD